MTSKGYVQVYTGDGKGKTTAALGLALRAAGAGLKIFIGQFVKGMEYSEVKALKRFSEEITIRQYGLDCFIYQQPTDVDIQAARKGLEEIGKVLEKGEHSLVILDEVNIATYYNLFSEEALLEVLENRHEGVEVVLTGRKAGDRLIAYADLVTDMFEGKHYYQKGVEAREGIEF
jgi:cob(I)alamin adenosyltransferase